RKLAALFESKDTERLTARPAPDKWSVAQIVAHLADAEIANAWRFRQILSSNQIEIQAYDQGAWAATFDYEHRDPRHSLEQFRVLRNSNVALLKSVPRRLWENYGLHQERGKESVAHLMKMVAGHDLNHLQQMEQLLKS
ncbi:MAG: DinB family protein, partial [Acidobacteriales bacterium]|nr:DinB family protein [Terriglobales bacterium]